MRRRDFVGLLASIPAACIRTARAQQAPRKRRIGVLMGLAVGDQQAAKYLEAFRAVLGAAGWKDGQNLQIDFRAATNLEALRSRASELIGLGPELVLTYTTPATNALHQVTQSVPILFVAVSDPIGTGFVESIAHPGRNITGFVNFEPTIGEQVGGVDPRHRALGSTSCDAVRSGDCQRRCQWRRLFGIDEGCCQFLGNGADRQSGSRSIRN